MKKFVCPICGYVHEGTQPPEKCPQCGCAGAKFTVAEEGASWAAEHIIGIAKEVEERLKDVHKSIHVAVMGCPVNGPGEAKNADLGVACGKGVGLIIKKGEIVCKVDEADICKTLIHELNSMI